MRWIRARPPSVANRPSLASEDSRAVASARMTLAESWISGSASITDSTRSAAACAICSSVNQDDMISAGQKKLRASMVKATTVPAPMRPR